MNRTKKVTILCVAIIAILAITVSVTFAFWDKTSAAFNYETVNAAGSVKLAAKAVGTFDSAHKLMPNDALIDTTTETKVLRIGGFHTNLSDPAGVETTETDIASRVKIKYAVKEFKIGTTDLTSTYQNTFEIIVNTSASDSSIGVLSGDVIVNDTDYYVWVKFIAGVKADTVEGYKKSNISVKFTLTAESNN